MEVVFIWVHLLFLLFQHAVFPVSAQTVVLTQEAKFVENSPGTFVCTISPTFDPTTLRQWIGPGTNTLISAGTSSDTSKYSETVDTPNKKYSMTIQNYNSADDGDYVCQYGFTSSNTFALSPSTTEAHPSASPLDNLVIPGATEAIDLTISVPNVRPSATASFNLTSSGTLEPLGSGTASVTATDDGNGRTFSYSLVISVNGGITADGDIFTIELVVGTYSVTKQWTIAERTCECDAVLALSIIGILLFVVDVILTWIAHFQLHGKIEHCLSLVTESKSGEGKLEWKTKLCVFRAGVTTVVCVIALILCIIGIAICKACNLGSPEQSETTGLILAAIGFAINLVVLILLIIMICLNRCRVLTISSSSNPDRTETNQVNPENENVTDDQKNQHKMEKADVIKATSEEMKGIDKTKKVDSV